MAKSSQDLQEQLRPLFCDVEINLESNAVPSGSAETVTIPSAFFKIPLLASVSKTLTKAEYNQFLQKYKMNFPETNLSDADHAWLTPVKCHADLLAITSLIKKTNYE